MKNNPNSKTWRNRCDKLISRLYRGKPCVICLQQGITNTNTCGHHIVNRSLSAALRHDLHNIIALCPSHHKFGNICSAHSTYQPAQVAFVEWLKRNDGEGYYCLINYKGIEKDKSYQEIYQELSGAKW